MFVKIELDVNIDDLVDTTEMSEDQIKQVATLLAENIIDRYLVPDYLGPEDIIAILSE